ncbi:GEVED domain-containing protein [Chryseobacterium koreense]|uniref:GEVED domain-containing protein n=1 Tax=Chryseobacterium koreense TaxID=232216 RepID=UPI0026EE287C|nr:GEVED domain-containing protein [Chryseobacterium koreense]
MKKLLLSCFLALGIGANAQLTLSGDFEDASFSVPGVYIQFGGGTRSAAAACSGAQGGQLAISNTVTQTGWAIVPNAAGKYDSGKDINVSINYKKASTPQGTLHLALFKQDPVTSQWNISSLANVVLASAAITTCQTLSATIPGSSLDPSANYGFGAFYVKSSGNGNIYVDNINITQAEADAVPACTSFVSPLDGTVSSSGTVAMSWQGVFGANNYKLTVGSTSGGSDIYNATVTGYTAYVPLAKNTTYYAKVVPSNAIGDASGCSEISFTTNNVVAYCPAGAQSAAYEKITNVNFAGINNSSSALSTAPGYEDFTSKIGTVNKESSYTFTAACSVTTYAADQILVWIDFNQNGSFNDPGELVFSTTGLASTWTGNIAIPATALEGNTRMRIRVHDTSDGANATSCGNSTWGQVEDYTINILPKVLGVSTVNKDALTVYPNPFKDILRISDVKNVKSISVSDVAGRQVKTLAPAAELNLSSLNAGLYIVTLHMNDGSVKTVKAIKK